MAEEEVRSHLRAEFLGVRSRFADRLACAQVFDRELFEALLLWLDALRRCYAAANLPMARSDFAQFRSIANHLEQEAMYSRDQHAECAAALARWRVIITEHSVS